MRIDLETATENADAFDHVFQAQSLPAVGGPAGFESNAVVFDGELHFMHVAFQPEADVFGAGMFQDVVQAFLDDAIKIQGGVLREKGVHIVQFGSEDDAAGSGGGVNQRFERAGQAEMVQLIRMQVV